MMIAALFICLALFMLIGVPISLAIILATSVAIIGFSDYSLVMIAQKLFSSSNSFPLMAIPLFVLAGNIMGKGGMSKRLIKLASALVGNLPGGIGMVSVLACMFFACISGSTAATTAAVGAVLFPSIVKSGFSKGSATGLLATSGSIGIIIPPSVPFILMGVIGGMSIGSLFLGGIIPGVINGVALMAVVYFIAKIQKHPPSGTPFSFSAVGSAFVNAIPALLTVVFVLGAILLGIATATEAAVIAVVWALFVCGLIHRELKWDDLPDILVETVKITGVVVFCIGATAPFAWLLIVEEVPGTIAEAMITLSNNPIALKLMILAILVAIGTFLDLTPAMIVTVPIFLPIANELGMDPIQFGVVTVMALGIGQSTPPVGIALFVACGISKQRIEDVARPLMPYLLTLLAVLLLTLFFSPLSTLLPQHFMK
jgi:C4-dicarboxylate transporter DctM subunit